MSRKTVGSPAKRNATATRDRVLKAAIADFSRYGFDGARTERVAKRASANIRMIYHYFGSKEGLYLAALEQVYMEVRTREAALNLRDHAPAEGMRALVEFTFNHLIEHPEFIELIRNENLLRGKYLKRSRFVPEAAMPLVNALRDLLARGVRQGLFRRNVDPIQLYISLLSLCFIHLSNRYTLSIMFRKDLSDVEWLAERLEHVQTIVSSFLNTGAAATSASPKARPKQMTKRRQFASRRVAAE